MWYGGGGEGVDNQDKEGVGERWWLLVFTSGGGTASLKLFITCKLPLVAFRG